MARPTEVRLMFAGHFAAGLAMKAKEPRLPTWALLLGVGLLDVLFGIFVVAGVEQVSMTPGIPPGFHLDFIDWSHSLVLSIVWALLFGAAFFRRGLFVASWCAFAVFSHFLLDLPMHPGDLALWPHSAQHFGFGLWVHLPFGWWLIELAFIVVCTGYYVYAARTTRYRGFGGYAWVVAGIVMLLHVANIPTMR